MSGLRQIPLVFPLQPAVIVAEGEIPQEAAQTGEEIS